MFDLHLTPEQLVIRQTVREFVEAEIKPIALGRDRVETFEERFPWEVLIKGSQIGMRTLALSQEHGGGGGDTLTCCIVAEEVAVGDVGIAVTLNQTSTFSHLLFDQATTPQQRQRFLTDFLADHRYHLVMAGHEPDTDLGWNYFQPLVPGTGYKTTAVRDGDSHWVISGAKNFITNGKIAKLIMVQARTDPTKLGLAGVSTFLVARDTPGLSIREHDKVGRRLGSNAELFFDDCRVPAENLLGEEGRNPLLGAGAGLLGRGSPRFQALNLGVGRAAYEAALAFSRLWVQGGKPIVEHQAVGLALAEMTVGLEVARSMIWKAAWAADHPEAYSDGSLPGLPLQTIAKVFTSETVHRAAVMAMQLFGGMGVMRELPMQKYVRDALIFLHSEATNDVARLRIAEALAGYQRAAVVSPGGGPE
ncbi:MAG: acyl-CoA dehydrogenase family protein [Dehalococcoidia bacterium]